MLLLGSVLTILLPLAANLHYIALIVIRFLIGASLVLAFILKFVNVKPRNMGKIKRKIIKFSPHFEGII